jgi:hypothetical protein
MEFLMVNRTVRSWLVVLASLSLTTIGIVAHTDHHSGAAPAQTSVAEQVQLLPSGVFGWD